MDASASSAAAQPARTLALGGCLAALSLLALLPHSKAQIALPTAAPVPIPSPTPAPGPGTSPLAGVDPALLLPQSATVQLATPKSLGATAALAALPAPLSLPISSPDLFAPTNLAAQPQAATVTLTYNPLCVGAKVLVAPLDGGTINGSPGGKQVAVGLDGTFSFSFQAPAGPGRYHVVTRLGTSEMALPFVVANPASSSASGK